MGVIGRITSLSTIDLRGPTAFLETEEQGLASHWAPVDKFLPVLRPFSQLCTPLEDGTVPAVEIGKAMYSGSNRAELVEQFDFKGRACVIKGPGTEVSISEYGFNSGTLAAGLVDLLREWHFAPLTAGKTLVEGVDYIAKSPATSTIEKGKSRPAD